LALLLKYLPVSSVSKAIGGTVICTSSPAKTTPLPDLFRLSKVFILISTASVLLDFVIGTSIFTPAAVFLSASCSLLSAESSGTPGVFEAVELLTPGLPPPPPPPPPLPELLPELVLELLPELLLAAVLPTAIFEYSDAFD